MSDVDRLLAFIASTRPSAQHVRHSHSHDFIEDYPGEPFHFITLYDAQIASNLIVSRSFGLIIVENTYLTSFAYNVMLGWIVHRTEVAGPFPQQHPLPLLKYNFKKFFAEQLLRHRNTVFSRAIFLETLLYEQQLMERAFALSRTTPHIQDLAGNAVGVLLTVTQTHELTHHFLQRFPNAWEELGGQYAAVAALVNSLSDSIPAYLLVEIKCDTIAVFRALQDCKTQAAREECLRVIVFGFAAFAVMSSLDKSAELTMQCQSHYHDTLDLTSQEVLPGGDQEYQVVLDEEFVQRASVIQRVCEELARIEGILLYDSEGAFPLVPTVVEDLLVYVETIMLNDDQNARKMSRMVATALHGHLTGLEFLSAHSQRFRSRAEMNG